MDRDCDLLDDDNDEPHGLDYYMIAWHHKNLVEQGVDCEELNYPASEATFATIEDWEEFHNKVWWDEFEP